jgi:serine/threonine protein kinase
MKLPEEPRFYKNQGFGPVYFGEIDGQKARIRWLTVTDISTFQLREVPEEIKRWKKVSNPSIEAILGEYHENDNMFIISECNENMVSLQSLLQQTSNQKLSLKNKKAISTNLIKAMLQLSTLGDTYSHGHLCPANILVDTDLSRIVVQDFAFHSLRTYCSMLTDYVNKDHYTSPEHLVQKGKVIKKSSHKGDIYSLGMILL